MSAVMLIDECPSIFDTAAMSEPAASRRDAAP
ncbi:hypothetical protein BH24ACT12_BH24ACT12_14140 [soil metagenome]